MRSGGPARSSQRRSRASTSGWNPIDISGSESSRAWTTTCVGCRRRRNAVGTRDDEAGGAIRMPRRATVTTSSERAIVITRPFDAPRSLVFEAWTKAEHVAQWWDPSGVRLAVCEIDLRPNGAFRFVHQGADGFEHPFIGMYREIVPPERLVFSTRISPSGPETVGTLVF